MKLPVIMTRPSERLGVMTVMEIPNQWVLVLVHVAPSRGSNWESILMHTHLVLWLTGTGLVNWTGVQWWKPSLYPRVVKMETPNS